MHRHDESLLLSRGALIILVFVFCYEKKSLKLSFVLKMISIFLLYALILQNSVAWAKKTRFADKKEKTTYAKNPLPEHDTSKYAKFTIQDRYDLYESMGNIKDRNNLTRFWLKTTIFLKNIGRKRSSNGKVPLKIQPKKPRIRCSDQNVLLFSSEFQKEPLLTLCYFIYKGFCMKFSQKKKYVKNFKQNLSV